MTDLDPAWLRSYTAIARTGSVTRASQQVHRTQSAVSTHLQHLEAAVGAQLVERSTRSLALTAHGLAFLPHAQALLRAQEEAHAAVRPAREAATVRIGLSEYFMPDRLGELLGVLRDAAGGDRLELLLGTSAPLQRHWAQGEADERWRKRFMSVGDDNREALAQAGEARRRAQAANRPGSRE